MPIDPSMYEIRAACPSNTVNDQGICQKTNLDRTEMNARSSQKSFIYYLLYDFPLILRTRLSYFVHGSMTVEAALGLPILLFFASALMAPMRFMDSQRKLQNALEAVAKDMSMAAYVSGVSKDMLLDRLEDPDGLFDSAFDIISFADLMIRMRESGADSIKDISITELSGIADEDEGEGTGESEASEADMIFYRVEYEGAFHAGFPGLRYKLSSVTNRRKWIGSEGGRGRDRFSGENTGEPGDDETEDKIVYVGKNGTRYHLDRHCHYIDNIMTEVDGSRVEDLRNSSGARYHACPSCDAKPEGKVYIFESGTSYHSSTECKSIGSYAKAYSLSEVEHLGPCSYCGGD